MCLGTLGYNAIAREGSQVLQQGAEVVYWQTLFGMLAGHFGRGTGGGLCRGPHRASGTLRALPIVLIEEQRREHLAHVTFHVVAEHAQEHMRAIGLVVEWPDV